jgi:hypothetical protein
MLRVLTSFHSSKHLIFKELSAPSHAAHYGPTSQHMLLHCYLYMGDLPTEVPTSATDCYENFTGNSRQV